MMTCGRCARSPLQLILVIVVSHALVIDTDGVRAVVSNPRLAAEDSNPRLPVQGEDDQNTPDSESCDNTDSANVSYIFYFVMNLIIAQWRV